MPPSPNSAPEKAPQKPDGAKTGLLVKLGLRRVGEVARKTVTFGDASAITGGKIWGVVSVALLAILWVLSSKYEWIDPIFWPPATAVWDATMKIAADGYRGVTLAEHVGRSLFRVFIGFAAGCLIGIPIGFAMGLSRVMRGFFDPLVEFFRPIPPLAFIPLFIIWFGIGELSKTMLLFFAALWIMIIAARSGVFSIRLSKIHAAYTLGASKTQILFRVILPNALPEIFIGMRVAMGVCWGTLVAAELVAAESGVGFTIMVASKFLATDIVVMGIFIIGVIGYGLDILMRKLEAKLIPWKGKG
jgi:taurine transport system permease protein